VNATQSEGVTPLHEAAFGGDVEIVRMLLDAGADPNVRSGRTDDGASGRNAIDFARDQHHADVVELLRARGAKE
jgi:ankyrin repeat protein